MFWGCIWCDFFWIINPDTVVPPFWCFCCSFFTAESSFHCFVVFATNCKQGVFYILLLTAENKDEQTKSLNSTSPFTTWLQAGQRCLHESCFKNSYTKWMSWRCGNVWCWYGPDVFLFAWWSLPLNPFIWLEGHHVFLKSPGSSNLFSRKFPNLPNDNIHILKSKVFKMCLEWILPQSLTANSPENKRWQRKTKEDIFFFWVLVIFGGRTV